MPHRTLLLIDEANAKATGKQLIPGPANHARTSVGFIERRKRARGIPAINVTEEEKQPASNSNAGCCLTCSGY